MPWDLKLEDDDLAYDGDLSIVREAKEVAQTTLIRMRTILGEYFLDVTAGLDWIDNMFSVKTSLEQKEAELKRGIHEVPETTGIATFLFTVDRINRGAFVFFETDTEYGTAKGDFTKEKVIE